MVYKSNYGIYAAKKRAKKKESEQSQVSKPTAISKKPITAPNLDWYPLKKFKDKLNPYSINWSDTSTQEISDDVNVKMKNEHMSLIVMPAGSGKTAVTVATIGKMQEELGEKLGFVVTAPAKVIEGRGWLNTIQSWNLAHPDNQLEPLLVTTIDKFASAGKHAKTMQKVAIELGPNGILVIDEIHKYKNPTSKRSKQLQKFSMFKRIGLSATPITNNAIMDSVSYLIMADFYDNKTDFMNRSDLKNWFGRFNELLIYNTDGTVDRNRWPYYDTMLNELARIIHRPNIDLNSLDMPNVKSHIVQLESDEILRADMRSLAQANQKRMFDSFTDYFMEIVERLYGDEHRLSKMIDIVKQDNVVQPIIFYWHVVVKDKIVEEFKKHNIAYQEVSGSTNFEDVDLLSDSPLLVQYQSGAEGIEMKHSNTSIFYQNQHSFATLDQARGRNVRRKMDHDVDQYYLVSDNAFDQEIFNRVLNREEISGLMLEEIVNEAMSLS